MEFEMNNSGIEFTMKLATEPAKLLLPFLQRAKELQKHDPLVAYYCRLYAMERGLKIPAKERTKATNALLVSLMNQLEKDKKVVKLSPDDQLYVEGFALNVFAKADKQDRAGHADLETAKTFYAASLFFEVLHQFGEIQPDIEQKQKYSVWKAADIRKAISEGQKPQPGPPAGDQIYQQLKTSKVSDGIERSVSLNADIGPKTSDIKPSPPALSSSFSSPDPPQAPSHPLYPTSHSSLAPTADQSSYLTAAHGPSHYPSSSQVDSSPPPPTTENSYLTSIHDMQAPSNVSYYSEQDLPPTPTPSPYPQNYAPAAMLYYPNSLQSSVPGVSNLSSYAPEYSSSLTGYPMSGDYVSFPSKQSGYSETLQHHRMASAPSILAESSGNETYQKNYQPPPDKIAEAHKASRFAVGALAFDDVPTAISYLKRSLELLTSPSAPIK
ncbi:hypothetical protein O6H91_04G017600 [Diphasiastrum complanatum]|uniref:Uncharacterized protein n=1 Tax=Diphasiastrum complanatum TaxID=34168 RepID=A0ACC2DUS7_DIPCM|nr:hypothetical protein O6H91_04G017600 [Diphasiastrum complanatum]